MVKGASPRTHFAFSKNGGENNDTLRKEGADVSGERGPIFSLVTRFRVKFFSQEGYSSQDLI